jgi:hypothetical protein
MNKKVLGIFVLGVLVFSVLGVNAGLGDYWNKITGKATSGEFNASVEFDNEAPEILFIAPIIDGPGASGDGEIGLFEAISTPVSVNFLVYDPNGGETVDELSANFSLMENVTGNTVRTSVVESCTKDASLTPLPAGTENNAGEDVTDVLSMNITCQLTMWYFDNHADDWIINLSVADTDLSLPLLSINDSNVARVLVTDAITLEDDVTISWSSVNLAGTNFISTDTLTINNTGNTKYNDSEYGTSPGDSDGRLKLIGYPLNGTTNIFDDQIPADKFAVHTNTGDPCSVGKTQLQENPTDVIIAGAGLYNGDLLLGGGIAQEEFKFCLNDLSGVTSAQSYKTTDEIWILVTERGPAI